MRRKVLILHNRPLDLFLVHDQFVLPKSEFECHLITTDRTGIQRLHQAFDGVHVMDFMAHSVTECLARHIIELHRVGSVVALSEKFVSLAAALRADYGLPGIPPDVALRFRNKLVMKRRLAKAGIRVPEFAEITSVAEAEQFISHHGRSVLKDVNGYGSTKLLVVGPSDGSAPISAFLQDDRYEIEIEEYVTGEFYHCDSVVADGVVQFFSVSRYLVAPGAYASSQYGGSYIVRDDAFTARVGQFNTDVIAQLGLGRGVTHLEFWNTADDELIFCEIAARPGGGGIAPPIDYLYGVNLFHEALRLEADPAYRFSTGAARLDHHTAGYLGILPSPGTVRAVRVPESLAILQTQVACAEGERLSTPLHCTDYAVHFVLTAPNETAYLDEVEALLQARPLEVVP